MQATDYATKKGEKKPIPQLSFGQLNDEDASVKRAFDCRMLEESRSGKGVVLGFMRQYVSPDAGECVARNDDERTMLRWMRRAHLKRSHAKILGFALDTANEPPDER